MLDMLDITETSTGRFQFAVAFFQIAIVLASVAIVANSLALLSLSAIGAGLGAALTVNGFFLIVALPSVC